MMKVFERSMVLEICASDEDVRRYVDERMSQSIIISAHPALQDTIRTKIVRAVDGMYAHPSINVV